MFRSTEIATLNKNLCTSHIPLHQSLSGVDNRGSSTSQLNKRWKVWNAPMVKWCWGGPWVAAGEVAEPQLGCPCLTAGILQQLWVQPDPLEPHQDPELNVLWSDLWEEQKLEWGPRAGQSRVLLWFSSWGSSPWPSHTYISYHGQGTSWTFVLPITLAGTNLKQLKYYCDGSGCWGFSNSRFLSFLLEIFK